jgi:hypothetical protein
LEVAELFREHRNHMFSVAYRMLGSAMDAEDAQSAAGNRKAAAVFGRRCGPARD